MKLLKRMFGARRAAPLPGPERELFDPDVERMTTSSPRILWVELTSKCPFKCVFCTREVRWGAGRNLDFDVYRSLIGQLEEPEFIGLNYSGESIHYPRLLEAIRIAAATGAYTELVTALSSASRALVQQIVESGLDRLAVSLHTLDARQYQDIYGFGSLESLKTRIDDIVRLKGATKTRTPRLDFCFVAMNHNIDQLLPVCRYALEVGVSEVFVHPVIGRHPVAYDFSRELNSNRLTPDFKQSLRHALDTTRRACPGISITVLNPDVEIQPVLDQTPRYYAASLPAGARIHTCDQTPFESVHVLANGDVVVCEVHDEVSLGNLHTQGIREIWHGERYRQFRRAYVAGTNPACRECVWKTAYRPDPWKSGLVVRDGMSPQLTRGWYLEPGAAAVWSKKRSLAQLKGDSTPRELRIAGILPQDPGANSNQLTISSGGTVIGTIENAGAHVLHFDRSFPLNVRSSRDPVSLEFTTSRVFRPSAHSASGDARDLGFALLVLELR